jgi:hypothetical protein
LAPPPAHHARSARLSGIVKPPLRSGLNVRPPSSAVACIISAFTSTFTCGMPQRRSSSPMTPRGYATRIGQALEILHPARRDRGCASIPAAHHRAGGAAGARCDRAGVAETFGGWPLILLTFLTNRLGWIRGPQARIPQRELLGRYLFVQWPFPLANRTPGRTWRSPIGGLLIVRS